MSVRRRIFQLAAATAGVAVAGTAVGVAHQRRVIARRGYGEEIPLGSLRSEPVTMVADDGVSLHVEVDDYRPVTGAHSGRPAHEVEPVTVVFVHGYALNLDCWHFQRAGYRGLVRTVFFDQRSHGRSGRSPEQNATIDQLGSDLRQVLDQVVPEGRVVLVGHSMGGMAILALAEHHPELFGGRVVGVGLVATTAGEMRPHRIVLPLLPDGLGGELATRLVAGLARTSRRSRTVDLLRRVTKDIAVVATDVFAFGDEVPRSYVEFVDDMLAQTPFEVLADFFPHFASLDKYAVLAAFSRIPTTIVGGTADRMTSFEHSRRLHDEIPGSVLVECRGAGHMVIMERHEQVNAALDKLLAAAEAHVPAEPE